MLKKKIGIPLLIGITINVLFHNMGLWPYFCEDTELVERRMTERSTVNYMLKKRLDASLA